MFGFSLNYSFDFTKQKLGRARGSGFSKHRHLAWGDLLLTLPTVFLLHLVTDFYPCPALIECSEDINTFFVYSSLGEAGRKGLFS